MKTILLTGGAGFIGSAIATQLAARGDRVVVLDKLTYAGHRQNLDGVKCELVEGDILDTELLKTLFTQRVFDAVIHAAAESHVDNSITGSAAFIETNVVGTHRLLEAARNAKVSRFIHISTDEVYGALGADGIFTTGSPMLPNSPYAASKAASDHLARSWFKTYGLPVIITRCCNNYGPRQHPEKLIPRMLTNASKGEKLPVYGDGKQVREWIHVDDHARGVIAAMERGTPGEIYHLGSGEERQNIELVERLCDLIGNNSRRLITHVTDRLGHDFRYALDVSTTETFIGFKPDISFNDGIAQTVEWYRAHPQWVATMLAWHGKMSILLFGAQGQVGARLAQQTTCVALTRHQADFTALDAATVERLVAEHQPTHIINAAGFTAVDAAETQSELAYAVNAAAPRTIAEVAAAHSIPFFHFSTDYVFDGVNGAPYREDDRTGPLNHYGKSKLLGEQAALEAGARVFRLQWVFDTRGSNFYLSMRKLLAERATLTVVADQVGAPSHASHIARAVLQSLELPTGLYHMAPQGHTSWHGFACAIAAGMKNNCAIAPITSAEYPLPATRPRDTRLDTSKLTAHGITLPHWRDGLQEALNESH